MSQNQDIYCEGDKFKVICMRCKIVFEVIRNFGGGVRREGVSEDKQNPAICDCGSRKLEVF